MRDSKERNRNTQTVLGYTLTFARQRRLLSDVMFRNYKDRVRVALSEVDIVCGPTRDPVDYSTQRKVSPVGPTCCRLPVPLLTNYLKLMNSHARI